MKRKLASKIINYSNKKFSRRKKKNLLKFKEN